MLLILIFIDGRTPRIDRKGQGKLEALDVGNENNIRFCEAPTPCSNIEACLTYCIVIKKAMEGRASKRNKNVRKQNESSN